MHIVAQKTIHFMEQTVQELEKEMKLPFISFIMLH